MSKLYKKEKILYEDEEYLLSCALLLLSEYDKKNEIELFEFAYNIVLRCALLTENYIPLYDVAYNYGFYPIVKYVFNKELLSHDTVQYVLRDYNVEKYKFEGYIETFEQEKIRKNILLSNNKNIAFVAPTSFGKSSLVIQHIKNNNIKKAVIIVPSKSLLSQVYMDLRENIKGIKIICHDEMYKEDEKFIGVLTQERLLRLLEKNTEIVLDHVYIDEAHNILKNDDRNILLTRTLKICKYRNKNLQMIFLSPFIYDVKNICMKNISEVEEQRIKYNLKEYNIYVKNKEGIIKVYDRFLEDFYTIGVSDDSYKYINENKRNKNFIFISSPRKIEQFTEELYNNTVEIEKDDKIEKLKNLLSNCIHPDFNIIRYLSHGIIYLHAKLPENIKEYLEHCFKVDESIKFLVANTVILEGINLPIDCLFISSLYHVKPTSLQNLVGRVNRLNYIFDEEGGKIEKLIPNIHFVDVINYTPKNVKMENAISRMYKQKIDEVRNPLLDNCNLKGLNKNQKERESKKNRIIKEQDKIYFSDNLDEYNLFRKKLISSGMNQIIDLSDKNIENLICNIKNCDFDKEIIDIVSYIFTNNIEVKDESFRRLKNKAAINFYKFFINEQRNGDFVSLINSQLRYHMDRKENEKNPYMYVGIGYGEEKGWNEDTNNSKKVYIDIREKTREQLINYLIVKTKIEQDFLNFQYNNAVSFLHDNDYIDDKRYNMEIYGTNDIHKIQMLNLGISMFLFRILDNNNQLNNISFDSKGNMVGNNYLKKFYEQQNDFIKYEMKKHIYFEEVI